MQVNAHADVDVIAIEEDDQVTLLLELAAPALPKGERRATASVQVVLDRSGSMAGERLDAAKRALIHLVDRLDPADTFGLVTFDDEVNVVVPAGAVREKVAIQRAIASVNPGGMTNLSSGLLRGMQEARRVVGDGGVTLLLLSDGHANAGETNPERLAGVAAVATARGIVTTTVGIGLDYDEALLAEVARGGQGSHVFAEHADAAGAAVAGEVEGLLSKTVQAASLVIRPSDGVERLTVWNDLPGIALDDGIMVELGDLWADEKRAIVLTFAVPAKSTLGLAQVAELEVRYVAVPGLVEQVITLPVHVNVVPGDQAAGRIPDPRVASELVYQQTQKAKRSAADAIRDGDQAAAKAAYDSALVRLHSAMASAPSEEIAEEVHVVSELSSRIDEGDARWAAKFSLMDQARKSRQRGRGDL